VEERSLEMTEVSRGGEVEEGDGDRRCRIVCSEFDWL